MDAYTLIQSIENKGYGLFHWPDLQDEANAGKCRIQNINENSQISSIDEKRRISKFLEKLTISEKLVIYLKAVGYEYSEIGEILGLTKSQISAIYKRIRRRR